LLTQPGSLTRLVLTSVLGVVSMAPVFHGDRSRRDGSAGEMRREVDRKA